MNLVRFLIFGAIPLGDPNHTTVQKLDYSIRLDVFFMSHFHFCGNTEVRLVAGFHTFASIPALPGVHTAGRPLILLLEFMAFSAAVCAPVIAGTPTVAE
jgi:hypothetical protein